MDKYFRRELLLKSIIGAIGFIVALIGYFLIDRDVENKKRLVDLESSSRVCEITAAQNSAGVAELFHSVQRLERACCKWGKEE